MKMWKNLIIIKLFFQISEIIPEAFNNYNNAFNL